MERLHFNTMVAALMEFTNYLGKVKEAGAVSAAAWEESIKTLLLLLAPTAPHLAEELWQRDGLRIQHPQPALAGSGTRRWRKRRRIPWWSR